jgi:hypothetical protein
MRGYATFVTVVTVAAFITALPVAAPPADAAHTRDPLVN